MDLTFTGLRSRASATFVAGIAVYFMSWALMPISAYGAQLHATDVSYLALLTGAVMSYGRVKGALGWLIGVSTAIIVTQVLHCFGQEQVRIAEFILFSVLALAILTYGLYCWVKHVPCNVILVSALLVALRFETSVAEYLTNPSFWTKVGSAPVIVFISWFIALIAGTVIGYSLLLFGKLGHYRRS